MKYKNMESLSRRSLFSGGSDKSKEINHQYHQIEDQGLVMFKKGHSFYYIDCKLLNDTLVNLET